jgi:hypothetical protein
MEFRFASLHLPQLAFSHNSFFVRNQNLDCYTVQVAMMGQR